MASWKNRIVGEGEADPTQLLANPKNWRIHRIEQEQALSGVLREVGLVDRILVNEQTGHVIDGHLRVAMAIREEQDSVPVQYVNLTEEEEALVLATFDPLSQMAGTDSEKLDQLLEELAESQTVAEDDDVVDLLDQLLSDLEEETVGRIKGSRDQEMDPKEKYEAQYMTNTVRQIQLVMDEREYEWALRNLRQIMEEEDVETNTEAVLALIAARVGEEAPRS